MISYTLYFACIYLPSQHLAAASIPVLPSPVRVASGSLVFPFTFMKRGFIKLKLV